MQIDCHPERVLAIWDEREAKGLQVTEIQPQTYAEAGWCPFLERIWICTNPDLPSFVRDEIGRIKFPSLDEERRSGRAAFNLRICSGSKKAEVS